MNFILLILIIVVILIKVQQMNPNSNSNSNGNAIGMGCSSLTLFQTGSGNTLASASASRGNNPYYSMFNPDEIFEKYMDKDESVNRIAMRKYGIIGDDPGDISASGIQSKH